MKQICSVCGIPKDLNLLNFPLVQDNVFGRQCFECIQRNSPRSPLLAQRERLLTAIGRQQHKLPDKKLLVSNQTACAKVTPQAILHIRNGRPLEFNGCCVGCDRELVSPHEFIWEVCNTCRARASCNDEGDLIVTCSRRAALLLAQKATSAQHLILTGYGQWRSNLQKKFKRAIF